MEMFWVALLGVSAVCSFVCGCASLAWESVAIKFYLPKPNFMKISSFPLERRSLASAAPDVMSLNFCIRLGPSENLAAKPPATDAAVVVGPAGAEAVGDSFVAGMMKSGITVGTPSICKPSQTFTPNIPGHATSHREHNDAQLTTSN